MIAHVSIENYKSIESCEVDLTSLTFLVGANGSGKSNFLDALCFTRDAVTSQLESEIARRGGMSEICHRFTRHARTIQIALRMRLPSDADATYGFSIRRLKDGGFRVAREWCRVKEPGTGAPEHHYENREGKAYSQSVNATIGAFPDRLALTFAVTAAKAFREVFSVIQQIFLCDPAPADLRNYGRWHAGPLSFSGENAPYALHELPVSAQAWVQEYVSTILPGLRRLKAQNVNGYGTLEFAFELPGSHRTAVFHPHSLSDGSLRALGILLALARTAASHPLGATVMVEHPEKDLHPFAVGVLFDALKDASRRTQVLVTTHSPDLLDRPDISAENILAVGRVAGATHLGPISQRDSTVIRQSLYTAGELLRMDQLRPDLDGDTPHTFAASLMNTSS